MPKDAVKTIRFASLENWGARIRHGGAGRSCPGLGTDQHMALCPGQPTPLLYGVRCQAWLGDSDTMNRTRGDTRAEKVSPCLWTDLAGAETVLLELMADCTAELIWGWSCWRISWIRADWSTAGAALAGAGLGAGLGAGVLTAAVTPAPVTPA